MKESDTGKKKEKKCFCEKEFAVEDIKTFYNSKKLFSAKNCPLPKNMKTYEEFTISLNKAMKDNNINTCLRKAHFLAQIEAETGFDTTLEYADGWDYDHSTHINSYNECISRGHNVKGYGPKYKGRGLLQLTWKDTYEAYFSKIQSPKYIDTPDIVASDLFHVCNSAAWYWREHSTWGDLNKYADNDDFISISVGINGGLRGFEHRKQNLKTILRLMKVEENCKNQKIPNLSIYNYDTSAIKNSKWGKNEKIKKEIKKYDD